ncbi:hypothetical protein AGLY_016457 [Aphis glycines]|uniref:Uncharacterized protein n=1 Tax=Aphis glycines TaxID=307491 RepID=A0A6G0SXP7_APHGL|nr:hypothetical protein AGLY_016457 [Aphis glycines]
MKIKKKGRPQDEDLANAFSNVCVFLESENVCQFGLNFLHEKMKGTRGKKSVVCFKNTGFKVLTNAWYDSKKANEEEERLRIVEAAATIIREDIRSFIYETDSFPPPNKFMNNVKQDIPKWNERIQKLKTVVTAETMANIASIPIILFEKTAQECKKLNQKTCFVTFDQPLYIKARNIVESYKSNPQIVVKLGGFHLLMSFMGSIDYIMAGSGLRELWNTIYASNSIDKMMTGHSRAVRAHMLTQLCLSKIILDEIELTEEYKITLKNYISNTDYTTSTLEDIENQEIIQDLIRKVENQIKIIASRGKTATLWIQYFYLVHILRQFIYAERMGNWYLHLKWGTHELRTKTGKPTF